MRYKSTKKQVHPPRFLLSPVFDAMHRWQNKCAPQWADSCSASRCHFQSPRCSVTNAGAPGGLNGGGYISIFLYHLKGYAFAFGKKLSRSNYIHIAGLGFTFPPSKGLQLVSRHSWSSSQVRALHWYPTLDEPLHSKPESVWIVEVKNWQVNQINLLLKILMLPQSSGEKTK